MLDQHGQPVQRDEVRVTIARLLASRGLALAVPSIGAYGRETEMYETTIIRTNGLNAAMKPSLPNWYLPSGDDSGRIRHAGHPTLTRIFRLLLSIASK